MRRRADAPQRFRSWGSPIKSAHILFHAPPSWGSKDAPWGSTAPPCRGPPPGSAATSIRLAKPPTRANRQGNPAAIASKAATPKPSAREGMR